MSAVYRDERRVLDGRIPGAVNFRDIGGYEAGDHQVAWGMVYRSAAMETITPDGWRLVADDLGVRTIINLRSAIENQSEPPLPTGLRRVYHSFSTESELTPEEQQRVVFAILEGKHDWADLYWQMLFGSTEAIRSVFLTLADADTLPTVIHCQGGRDRTGVTVGLILRVLGVSIEDIAQDYHLTGDLLVSSPVWLANFDTTDTMGIAAEIARKVVATTPDPMRVLFSRIDAEHGGVDALLTSMGVPSDALATVRSRLLIAR